jgi:hypothetical protein
MIDIDKVVEFAKLNSPLLPAKIAKEFKIDNLIAGAVLSQLVSEGRLLVSTLKVGGSPLYYASERVAYLLDHTKYLNEKDQRTLAKLREEKVLLDSAQEPLYRVSLRAIKDFAKPITVKENDQEELFWKWFLISDDEAKTIIENMMHPKPKEKPLVEKEEKKEEKKVEPKNDEASKPSALQFVEKDTSEEKKSKPEELPSPEKKMKKSLSQKPLRDHSQAQQIPSLQKPLIQKIIPESQLLTPIDDPWAIEVLQFFQEKKLPCAEVQIKKKNQELTLIVNVSSVLGSTKYFCKAISKKKIADADIMQAILESQSKNLPLLFVTTGNLSKKTSSDIGEKFAGILFVQLGV